MRIDALTIPELLTRMQTYYGAGTYNEEDIDVWVDEFGNRDSLFLGCLFIAIRREHSKTFKTLPDVAIATKCLASTNEIYSKVEKATAPVCIEQSQEMTDMEREEMAEALRGLQEKLLSGGGKMKVFHSVDKADKRYEGGKE